MTAPSLLFDDLSLAQVLDSWRSAANDVRHAWHRYLAADRPSARAATFAAYVAALDLESTAAEELRSVSRSL
jgi:hypothetical protein